VELEERGRIGRRVLDVGCGTGENALFFAQAGHEVVGVDLSSTAVERARAKARERGVVATFLVANALRLPDVPGLGGPFDSAIDFGLFHVLGDAERPEFAASLRDVLSPGGTYHFVCFSEHEPGDWGPRRVTQREIRDTFTAATGWRVELIEPAELVLIGDAQRAAGWRASLTRL
jgi:cyclopropane fatty-acyl-phospholipid synthase-like methyltransferase